MKKLLLSIVLLLSGMNTMNALLFSGGGINDGSGIVYSSKDPKVRAELSKCAPNLNVPLQGNIMVAPQTLSIQRATCLEKVKATYPDKVETQFNREYMNR